MNGVKKNSIEAYVLDGHCSEDVAQAMIASGKQKEPFHIFDIDEAYSRFEHFKKMFPRVNICYAMKANDYELMLKLAASEGAGFDCASPGEIKKILQLGVDPRRIIYAVTMKTPEQMMFAHEAGVKHTTFDTSYELIKIKKYWPDANLLIRIRVESNSVYKLGEKFGCENEADAKGLLNEAAVLGLRVVGVAFHVGSACFSPKSYDLGLRFARALFDHEEQCGRSMTIVDIGGGFLSDRTDRIDEVADLINSTLEELFPEPNVQVIAEPGRYLCDSAFTLYCNVINTRHVYRNGKMINFIYINDGVYGTLRFTESWHTVKKLKLFSKKDTKQLENVILYGPSGDNTDVVMKDHEVKLPRCTPSDWLVFSCQGAYTHTFATMFSCLPIPLIRPIVSLEIWNKIKDSDVFSSTYFVMNPDISFPLPSTIPTLPNTIEPLQFELNLRNTRRGLGFHPYVVDLPPTRTKRFASTFIMRTAKEWNSLPADVFPEHYNLGVCE